VIGNRGKARAGAAMAACGTAALLALTGCSSGRPGSPVSGQAHTISTPARLGSYTRSPSLETALDIDEMRQQIANSSTGRASDVVSAVYVQGNPAPGGNQQVFMFVGGHLANGDPAVSIASFERTYPRTQVVSAGSLGGRAACVMTTASRQSVAMCVWFDNDSFGTLVSPTMPIAELANALETVRPGIEHVRQ
jgi:hypothetical protein